MTGGEWGRGPQRVKARDPRTHASSALSLRFNAPKKRPLLAEISSGTSKFKYSRETTIL